MGKFQQVFKKVLGYILDFFSNDIKAALEVATINAGAVISELGAQKGLLTKSKMMKAKSTVRLRLIVCFSPFAQPV